MQTPPVMPGQAPMMVTLLPVTRNVKNKFTVARLHYSADPEKNTPQWIEEAKRGMPERGWLREYEIDYSVYEGKTFFPEFKDFNIKAEEYQTHETIYRGWDYGFHRPCVLITKLNQYDQWAWIDMILGKDEGIMKFGQRVREYCLTRYPGAYYVDAGDPAGEQQSDKSEKTSVQVLESIGIFVRSRKQPILQGAEIIRQKLPMRVDGRPGLIVHPKLTSVVDGFKGGLHYPEVKEGLPQKEFYEKDGYYDHIFDAARYLATDMFTVIGQQQQPNQMTMDHEDDKYRYRMGRPADDPQQNDLGQLSNELVSDSTDLGEYW